MFDKCCSSRIEKDYLIHHNPKPLVLSPTMDNILKRLLWYVPNIDSFQSSKFELIDNKLYDDFSFLFILNLMGMNESDVDWLASGTNIDEATWEYYENKICTNCQKIIISGYSSQTKTHNLLRCVRNSIAHGHFAICEELFIGFNKDTTTSGVIKRKAIIKIKPELFLNAIDKLTSPMAKEYLVKYAFERVGYTVTIPPTISFGDGIKHRVDWLIEKNGKKYYLDIKAVEASKYLHSSHLYQAFAIAKSMNTDIPLVLMIDTARMTNEVKSVTSELGTIYIVDLNLTKELLSGVDVLSNRDDIH